MATIIVPIFRDERAIRDSKKHITYRPGLNIGLVSIDENEISASGFISTFTTPLALGSNEVWNYTHGNKRLLVFQFSTEGHGRVLIGPNWNYDFWTGGNKHPRQNMANWYRHTGWTDIGSSPQITNTPPVGNHYWDSDE